jgi:hypothetical protein
LQQRAEQSNSVLLDATGDQNSLEQSLRGVDGVSGLSVRPHPVRHGVVSIECLVQDMDGIESRIARAVMAAGELYRLERRQPTLENVFLGYVGHAGGAVVTDLQQEAA